VNSKNSFLNKKLKEGDRISIYPIFETIDISPIKIINEKRVKERIYKREEDYSHMYCI
jgi:hypothetical protein